MKNNIGYKGVVTIKKLRGSSVVSTYTVYNEGTSWLFQQIAACLCGKEFALTNMPQYIDVVGDNGSVLAYRPAITSKRYSAGGNDVFALFETLIPGRIINVSSLAGENQYQIQLHSTQSDSNNSLLAFVELGFTDDDDVTASYSYQIEWKTIISNVVSDEED